jgi:hypothetical protein
MASDVAAIASVAIMPVATHTFCRRGVRNITAITTIAAKRM